MTLDQIVNRLMREARDYAKSRGYRLGDGADNHFLEGLRRAAQNIQKRKGDALESTLLEYRKHLERLIDEMIRQSDIIPGYRIKHPGIIGEDTFWAALSVLCPLPPFC
jgi:hypothetical protein